jgi:antitoxin VapB
MALSIKSDEADRLARELAGLTGESLTRAVVESLRERLERKRAQRHRRPLHERLARIAERYRSHPLVDERPPDTILGYDQDGLPA